MFHVACQQCGAFVLVTPGPCQCDSHPGLAEGQLCSGQFHEALDAAGTCTCCAADHNHRLATIETGRACRPVHITILGATPVRL